VLRSGSGVHAGQTEIGPGSAEQRCTQRRVRDKDCPFRSIRSDPR
jgi:hypothetical protein